MAEESTEQNNIVKQPRSYKDGFWHGTRLCASIVLVMLLGFSYWVHQKNVKNREAQVLLEKQNEFYLKSHAAFVADSLKMVAIEKDRFKTLQFKLHVYDSAKAAQRYYVGDIVYIKPDSTIAVVKSIYADSLLYYYSYILVVSNKDGNETMCERTDKMLY